MELGIDGRVALVVGGSGLLGKAVARALAAEGAVVVIAGRDEGRLAEAASGVPESVETVVVDTRSDESVRSAVAEVTSRHGRLDILVNTAAPSARTLDSSRDRDPEQILDAIDGKAMGYLRCANAALPVMSEVGFGRIVSISGQNARLTGSVTATLRNSAVTALSKNLADAVAGSGVTVNVVDPGPVTPEPSRDIDAAKPGESTPEQVAAAVVFLCSTPAAAISGESIALGHRVRGVQ